MIDPVLGTLLGTALGAAMGFFAQWMLAGRQERLTKAERNRNFLEDLHLRIEEYSGICGKFLLDAQAPSQIPGHARKPVENEYMQLAAMLIEPLPVLKSLSRRYVFSYAADQFNAVMNAAAQVYVMAPGVAANQVSTYEIKKKMNLLQIACNNLNHQIEKRLAEM